MTQGIRCTQPTLARLLTVLLFARIREAETVVSANRPSILQRDPARPLPPPSGRR